MNKLGSVEDANRTGVKVSPLFKDDYEDVRLEYWKPNIKVQIDTQGGAELFVLEGGCNADGDELRKHSWLRIPVGETLEVASGDQGAKVWIKSGHLIGL